VNNDEWNLVKNQVEQINEKLTTHRLSSLSQGWGEGNQVEMEVTSIEILEEPGKNWNVVRILGKTHYPIPNPTNHYLWTTAYHKREEYEDFLEYINSFQWHKIQEKK